MTGDVHSTGVEPTAERSHRVERLGSITRRIGNHQHFRWLKSIVTAVIVLNVLDGALTILWIYTGRATEANPLMHPLVHNVPTIFMIVKLGLVGCGSLLLWHFRRRRFAVICIFVGFLVYYAILVYHLNSLDIRLLDRVL